MIKIKYIECDQVIQFQSFQVLQVLNVKFSSNKYFTTWHFVWKALKYDNKFCLIILYKRINIEVGYMYLYLVHIKKKVF